MRKLYAIANIYEEGKEEPLHKDILLRDDIISNLSVDIGIGCEDVVPITKHRFSIEVVIFEKEGK